jgi:hypothetical protein
MVCGGMPWTAYFMPAVKGANVFDLLKIGWTFQTPLSPVLFSGERVGVRGLQSSLLRTY